MYDLSLKILCTIDNADYYVYFYDLNGFVVDKDVKKFVFFWKLNYICGFVLDSKYLIFYISKLLKDNIAIIID